MSGSLRTFNYTTNDGNDYLYTADESNTEAIHPTVPNPPGGANLNRDGIPRNIKPRTAYYSSSTTSRALRIIVANLASIPTLPATIPDPITVGDTLNLAGITAEKVRLYKLIDTGLTDGDNP